MTRFKTWQAMGALALTATLVLSGCGDKKDEASGASDQTSSAAKESGTDLTKDTFFSTIGKAQAEAGSSHVEMTTGVGGQEIKAKGDLVVGDTPSDSAMALTMQLGAQGDADIRVVKNIVYLNFGPATQNKFVKVDLTDKSNPLAQQYGSLIENFDPTAQADAYKDAVKSVTKKSGTEKIDGVETTAYVVAIDPKKLAGAAADAKTAEKLPDNFELTMYIGPDNLPRKVTGTLVASGTSVKMTMLYSKWGEKVDVKAPAASEVTDKNPLAGMTAG